MPSMHAKPFAGEARDTIPLKGCRFLIRAAITGQSGSHVSVLLTSLAYLHDLYLRTSPQMSEVLSVYLATLTLASDRRQGKRR